MIIDLRKNRSSYDEFIHPGPLVFRLGIIFASDERINVVKLYTQTMAYAYDNTDTRCGPFFGPEGAMALAQEIQEFLRRNSLNLPAWKDFMDCPIALYRNGNAIISGVDRGVKEQRQFVLRWKREEMKS